MAEEPAKEAAIRWVIPSISDVAYNYIRPGKAMGVAGAGGGRRGKKGKASKFASAFGKGGAATAIKKTPGLGADSGSWVGKKLPGTSTLQNRAISDAEKLFFTFGDLAQRALFILFLGDLLTDFFYDWAVLMDETEHCQAQFRGGMHYQGGPFNYGGVIPCNAVFAPNLQWKEGGFFYLGNQGGFPARPCQIIIAMECENTGLFPSNFQLHLGITDMNGPHNASSKIYFSTPGQEFGVVTSFSARGPGTFNVIACATASTLITADTIDVVAYGGGSAPIPSS